ncbi:MAG: hypothetical protein RI911_500 [Candidatus Parcubacteria bacterium]|jgi:uncharacterized LabA/DUF88 family protein
MSTLAFIDGQNLHLGTKEESWTVDLARFRVYLKDKYAVTEAYYFLGYVRDDVTTQTLYTTIQKAGFILIFKEHSASMYGQKKGNVDTDIVFEMFRHLIDDREQPHIVLVSGDGDYKKVVDYLISKKLFKKILFPNKKYASSLYKKLGAEYYDYLHNVRSYIERKSTQ